MLARSSSCPHQLFLLAIAGGNPSVEYCLERQETGITGIIIISNCCYIYLLKSNKPPVLHKIEFKQ